MKKALLGILVVLAFSACSRGQPPASRTPAPGPASPEDRIVYYPSTDRVLAGGDDSSDDIQWKPLGIRMPADLARVHHALVLSDTALTDMDGNSKGSLVRAGSRVSVRDVGRWQRFGSAFSRLYQIQGADPRVHGWIDSDKAALILAETPGLQVGILPRKIVIGGGEAEYNLLVVADADHVTILDTSFLPFPDEFHPSGVLGVSLVDANRDPRAEITLEAETIVSLRDLGSTPVKWKAWLRRGAIGALVSIFRYNESFGSDSGYAYSATDRLLDSTGSGGRGAVRVDTDYTLVTGDQEFHNRTVSFYPWNGNEFRHEPLEDLPRLGTVTVPQAVLRASASDHGDTVATLARGDQLYVSDRSDAPQSATDPASWWYLATTKSGIDGWLNGTSLDLSWIDPLKTNRDGFLTQ